METPQLKIDVPHDPAILLLSTYLKGVKSVCTCLSVASLFTIFKGWNQSRGTSDEERINKMWNTHPKEYSPVIKTETLYLQTRGWKQGNYSK